MCTIFFFFATAFVCIISKNYAFSPQLKNRWVAQKSTRGVDIVQRNALVHQLLEKDEYDKVKEMILADSSQLTIVDSEANTCLHLAAKWGLMDMVQWLVEQGSYVNIKNDRGRTPLHWATSYEYKDISLYLASKGADLRAENKDGIDPLYYAKKQGWDKELIAAAKGVEIQPAPRTRGDW